MDNIDINVSLSPDQAAGIVQSAVSQSISAQLVDSYTVAGTYGSVIVLVFDKYFMRNSSRASLTVTIENLKGFTHVHAAGSGGGESALFRFDWGAGRSFSDSVARALEQYRI